MRYENNGHLVVQKIGELFGGKQLKSGMLGFEDNIN